MQNNNELQVNPNYLAYYMLLYIVYIDNNYKIYKILKKQNHKYLVKIY